MASTRRLTPVVVDSVDALIARFGELTGSEEPVNVLHALSAFANGMLFSVNYAVKYAMMIR